MGVGLAKKIVKPGFALADVGCAGIVGSIGKPERKVAAAEALCDGDAVARVLESLVTGSGVGTAEGAVLVDLVLEVVGVDGARTHAVLVGERFDRGRVGHTAGQIPQDVESHCGAYTGKGVDLAGVAELFFQSGGGAGLQELAEAGASVRETPRGKFDAEAVVGVEDSLGDRGGHSSPHSML